MKKSGLIQEIPTSTIGWSTAEREVENVRTVTAVSFFVPSQFANFIYFHVPRKETPRPKLFL
jgi:hypothetical protein